MGIAVGHLYGVSPGMSRTQQRGVCGVRPEVPQQLASSCLLVMLPLMVLHCLVWPTTTKMLPTSSS